MKEIVLLFLVFTIFFSYYSDPPIEEVLQHNKDISATLFSSSLSSILSVSPSDTTNLAQGEIRLIALSPSVNERISSSKKTFLFWGAFFSFFETKPEVCGIKFDSQKITYSLNFTFRNNSKVLSDTVSSPLQLPLYVEVPFSEQELEAVQAEDQLTINLDWKNEITYKDYNLVCVALPLGGVSCSCEFNRKVDFSLSGKNPINYTVDGGKIIYFLNKPILKEQWHKNNHFDSITVSNRKIYKAESTDDENTLGSFILYNFDVIENDYGIKSIIAIKNYSNHSNCSEFKTFILPFPLEKENNTFSFVYTFNSSYEGFGEHNLSLSLTDYFGNSFYFNNTILSTMLTYDNSFSELGERIDPNKKEYRKSADHTARELNNIIIPASVLSVLFVLVFIRFR